MKKTLKTLLIIVGASLMIASCRCSDNEPEPCNCKDSGLWIDGDGTKYESESECNNLSPDAKTCREEDDCDCDD